MSNYDDLSVCIKAIEKSLGGDIKPSKSLNAILVYCGVGVLEGDGFFEYFREGYRGFNDYSYCLDAFIQVGAIDAAEVILCAQKVLFPPNGDVILDKVVRSEHLKKIPKSAVLEFEKYFYSEKNIATIDDALSDYISRELPDFKYT